MPSDNKNEHTRKGVTQVTINEHQSGQRIDNFLVKNLKGVPKSHVYRLLRSGQVRVNSGRKKPHYKLQTGDVLRIPPVRVSENNDETVPDSIISLLKDAILYEPSWTGGMAFAEHDIVIIGISQQDIEDIKLAQHDSQFERIGLKEDKIKSFENRKAMIDHEISKLMTTQPDKELPQLLNDEQHKALDELKLELSNLRDVNKRYAKFVLTVSNLYNSFLERLVPTEMQGYNTVASKNPAILEVRV